MSSLGIRKWNLTIESPTKFFRALEDALHDDLNYSITFTQKPELQKTAIEGTAKFEGLLRCEKPYYERSKMKLILGITLTLIGIIISIGFLVSTGLVIGIVLLIIGLILLVKMKNYSKLIINMKLEGESYKAGAGREVDKERDKDKTERVGIISDTRLTVNPRIEGKYGNKEVQLLNLNMEYLVKKVKTELIPRFKLPEIK